jgi:hypothetical protein
VSSHRIVIATVISTNNQTQLEPSLIVADSTSLDRHTSTGNRFHVNDSMPEAQVDTTAVPPNTSDILLVDVLVVFVVLVVFLVNVVNHDVLLSAAMSIVATIDADAADRGGVDDNVEVVVLVVVVVDDDDDDNDDVDGDDTEAEDEDEDEDDDTVAV